MNTEPENVEPKVVILNLAVEDVLRLTFHSPSGEEVVADVELLESSPTFVKLSVKRVNA